MALSKFIVFFFIFFALQAKSQSIADTTTIDSNEIVFTSDTQGPIWVESILLKPNHNRSATRSIFNNIATRQPKAVFILGDVVSLGNSNKQWKRMDVYLKKLRDSGVAVNATLGNHDVMGQPKKGQKKFQKRFPNHLKTGYLEVVDSVAVILLNSNFKNLSATEIETQTDWYRSTLSRLDADSSIQFIITGCHHSPYTNSKIVGASSSVKKNFVTYFMKSAKSRLFLSGHTHAFEHFRVEGKDFMVIGGGGGLTQPLRKTAKKYDDLDSTYKPMFHYLSVRRLPDHLEINSIRLKANGVDFENGLNVKIYKDQNSITKPITAETLKSLPAK